MAYVFENYNKKELLEKIRIALSVMLSKKKKVHAKMIEALSAKAFGFQDDIIDKAVEDIQENFSFTP